MRRSGDLGGIEYERNGKRVDVAVIRPHEKIAYEVVMTGPLDKEVSNLRKDLAAGFDQVVFAVESEEIRERLVNLIAREVAESEDRVEVQLLRQFS